MMKFFKKFRQIEAVILLAVIAACAWGMTGFMNSRDAVCSKVLRMHVVANSDSDADQQLKLKVRDAVLAAGADIFDGSVSADEATQKILPRTAELEAAARKVIQDEGFGYRVKIAVREEYFGTRAYGDVTLPAGRYMAVRTVIGEGEGKNWWCVMFPPLCLPAAAGEQNIDLILGENGAKLVSGNPQIEVRFKFAEICGDIGNFFEKIFN